MELNNTDRISAAKFFSLVWDVAFPFELIRNEKRFAFLKFFKNASRFQVFLEASREPSGRPESNAPCSAQRARIDEIFHGHPTAIEPLP